MTGNLNVMVIKGQAGGRVIKGRGEWSSFGKLYSPCILPVPRWRRGVSSTITVYSNLHPCQHCQHCQHGQSSSCRVADITRKDMTRQPTVKDVTVIFRVGPLRVIQAW